MADQKLTDLLAAMVKTNAVNRPLPSMREVTGLSQAILSNVGVQDPYKSNAELNKKDPRGPSVVNRVLDVLSRPLYGVLTPIKEEIKSNNTGRPDPGIPDIVDPRHIWAGLSGKEKTTGRDILEVTEFDDNLSGFEKGAIGFGIDVLADPLTYVGGIGLAGKVGKGAKVSTEALAAVEQGTGRTAQNIAEEISQRAAKQADDLRFPAPKPDAPVAAIPNPNNATPMPGAPLRALPGPEPKIPSFPVPMQGTLLEKLMAERAGTSEALKNLAAKRAAQKAGKTLDDVDEPTLVLNAKQSVPMKALDSKPHSFIPEIKRLNEQIAATKSPVAKNLLRKELDKLRAGVKPADILSEARVAPAPFPELTINSRWIDTARQAAQEFLKSNRMRNINHVGQTNLYNKVLHAASKVRKDRRQFHVLQMLRIAEEEVLAAGRSLTDAEGISVRLTDVANMMGGPRAMNSKVVDDFRNARPSQRIEDLKSYTTPQVVVEVLDPVIKAGADLTSYVKQLPPSQTKQTASEISRELSKIAQNAGASSREAGTAKKFIDDLFSVDRDKLYSVIEQEARALVRQSSDGILNAKTLHRISDEVYKSLGVNAKVLGREVQQTKVTEGIMTKFATWWGAKDLKPFSREYIDTARNVAAAFSETMKPIVRNTTATQRKNAWAVAAGRISAGTPEEQALADQFKYIVERLMGTHGITDNAEAVVLRSGTMMKELNEELPKQLRLTDAKGTDDVGRAFDYSKGQWMHSWKEWKIDEPAEALYQLTRSLQMVTRKNSMWDDAAARWGMPMKGAEFQHTVNNIPRLKGTFFPKQVAQQLDNLQRQMDRDVFKTPNKAVELFDKVQRMWKTGVTIYSPSHHIRNLNGDIYLAALDGVTSVRPYSIATKVLHAYPSRYKDLESVFNIMDPNLRERALRSRPGNTVLTTKYGEKVTAEQLYQAAESQGLFIRAVDVEDLSGMQSPSSGTWGTKFQPFGGRVYGAATRTSELRDHWVRLAHFADIISKSKQPLRIAIEQAGRRVKKFHPDGMDLTGFEQNVMRRVIPFYSWMRKATPLIIEGAIMRPHISLAFPKAMANIQLATGIESQGPADPFPMDQMFPEWLKEKGIGPILNPGSGLGRDETWRGEAPGYTIVNPTNPFIDQIAQLGSPAKTLLSGLTPAARIPLELLTGQSTLGIPLENVEGGVPGHLAQQIPAVGIGARLTGMTRDNEPWNPEQLINWLSGMGVTGTGPYQAQSQAEYKQLLEQLAKQNRGDYR